MIERAIILAFVAVMAIAIADVGSKIISATFAQVTCISPCVVSIDNE